MSCYVHDPFFAGERENTLTDERATKISSQTLIPVGVVTAVLVALVTAGWTAAAAFTRMQSSLENLTIEVSELKEKDTWTTEKMKAWVMTLRALNPEVKFPPGT